MTYLKISFLIIFIFVLGCTNKIVYVDKGKRTNPKGIPLTKKVVYKVQDEYKKNPITCLAIFPLEFESKIKVSLKDKVNMRKIFYAYISPLAIQDVELSRLDYLKEKFPGDNFGKLSLRENCNSYFVGRINIYSIANLGFFSRNSVGGIFSIYNAKNKNLIWRASHISSSSGGKLPLNTVDILLGAMEAAKNISEEQQFRIIGDLARRISNTIPEYSLASQAMFKEDEEIQFDTLVISKDTDITYIKDFDKILESNIELDKKIDLIEPLMNQLTDDNKTKYAEFLIENDRYENALQKLDSLSNTSKEHYVFFLRSRALIALQKYNQADKEIIKAIQLNKKNYQYYNVLGFINSKNDKFDRSLAAYKMAIEKNKDNAFAYFNSGIIYFILNYNEKAADYLYTAGLIYHKKGAQLDVMNVINQLKLMKTKAAKVKLKKLRKITNLKG